MLLLDKIAEANIRAAQERGELDNLPGEGKPLELVDDSSVPPELRAGYRILKNSGYLPAELVLFTEIKRVEDLLKVTEIKAERMELVVKLGLLKSQIRSHQSCGLR